MIGRILTIALIGVAGWFYLVGTSAPAAILEVTSASGAVSAAVFETSAEYGESTQVLLTFHEERCGAGAVSAAAVGLGLDLRWVADTVLQVLHPSGVEFTRNASGEVLQCGGRQVRVALVRSP